MERKKLWDPRESSDWKQPEYASFHPSFKYQWNVQKYDSFFKPF